MSLIQNSKLKTQNFIHKHTMPLVLLLALVLLNACTLPQQLGVNATQEATDILPPESPVKNFFSDLELALRDPNLDQEQTRSMWVERLAAYFAPNEQADQRVSLNDSLNNFANDRKQLGEDETLTIQISLGEIPKPVIQADRALVLLPNAKLSIQLARITDNGIVPYYEQPIEIARLTGRSDHSIPTIRINNRWYLTTS